MFRTESGFGLGFLMLLWVTAALAEPRRTVGSLGGQALVGRRAVARAMNRESGSAPRSAAGALTWEELANATYVVTKLALTSKVDDRYETLLFRRAP